MQGEESLQSISEISFDGRQASFQADQFFEISMQSGQIGLKNKITNFDEENFLSDTYLHRSHKNSTITDQQLHPNLYQADSNNFCQRSFHQEGDERPNFQLFYNENIAQENKQREIPQVVMKTKILKKARKSEENVLVQMKKDKIKNPRTNKLKKSIQKEHQNEQELNDSGNKNQTKNIPKNYGKAIITYIQKFKEEFEQILCQNGVTYEEFLSQLTFKKKSINTIANLRDLWIDFKYSKCMRLVSNQFLRKHALHYIFNSRICNFSSHIKYRKRFQEAIENPSSFKHIKQY